MCHLVPLFFILGIVAMLGEGFIIGLLLIVFVVGIKLIFTTGDKWFTAMMAFMVAVIIVNTIT
jgi:hypothetical protein